MKSSGLTKKVFNLDFNISSNGNNYNYNSRVLDSGNMLSSFYQNQLPVI